MRLRLLALLALPACAVPAAARTADVVPAHAFMLGGYIGGTFGGDARPDGIPLDYLANFGISARYGFGDVCDSGVDLGALRQGVDLRCSIVDTHRGDALDVTPVVGVAYQPRRGAEYRAGVDVGTKVGGLLHPLANLTLSHGAEFLWTPKPDGGGRGLEESAYDQRTRTETRLEATFGLGLDLDNRPYSQATGRVVLGVTPYWVLAAPGDRADRHVDGVMFTLGGGAIIP